MISTDTLLVSGTILGSMMTALVYFMTQERKQKREIDYKKWCRTNSNRQKREMAKLNQDTMQMQMPNDSPTGYGNSDLLKIAQKFLGKQEEEDESLEDDGIIGSFLRSDAGQKLASGFIEGMSKKNDDDIKDDAY